MNRDSIAYVSCPTISFESAITVVLIWGNIESITLGNIFRKSVRPPFPAKVHDGDTVVTYMNAMYFFSIDLHNSNYKYSTYIPVFNVTIIYKLLNKPYNDAV